MSSRSPANHLRAFGMSGAQMVSDIKRVENATGYELLDVRRRESARRLEGYERFEADIRSVAYEMSEFYEIFYCLEVSIRRLVQETFLDAVGPDWWESERVEEGYRTEVATLRKRDADTGMTPRSENALDYLTFGQLNTLITKNFDLFETVLNNKSAVSRILNQLGQLRNPIAHCCPLAEDEKERLELAVRDWFRVMS